MFVTPFEAGFSPHEAALRLAHDPGLAWLDGGLVHGQEGRFSFVGVSPSERVERRFGEQEPLSALDLLPTPDASGVSGSAALEAEDVPAWIGHIAYDAAWSGRPNQRLVRNTGLPCVRFARYDALYAYDHRLKRAYLVGDDAAACARLKARLERPALSAAALQFTAGPVSATDPERHQANVRSALASIHAGDVYEVNLARRYAARFEGSALGLFLRMRALSPVPLGYFMQTEADAVLGRSMERFLRYRARDGALWTSPIKGTIARAGDEQAEAQTLRADPKEHAEHAMVVDLMRNDLSRVSVPGSVQIRELMQVLPFAGLSHLVSTVEARALPQLQRGALLAGTFPPGSVTGAPKQSALHIIEALEADARGIYTGALGFVDRAGGFSLAVAIRTAVVQSGSVEYFAGGGIVVDSDPERETAETDLKAQVFLRALAEG